MLLGVYALKETIHRSKTAVPSPHVKRLPPQGVQSVVQLGLRANWQQFTLLVIVNAFVGGMVGLERSVVPLLGQSVFGLASTIAVLSFIVSFGIVKALANLFAGRLSDRIGRKGVLVVGWLFGLPVPFLIIFAPSWSWVFFVRESHGHAHHEAELLARPSEQTAEAAQHAPDQTAQRPTAPSFKEIFFLTSWKNRTLFSVSQAGLVNNLNDGLAWGLLPLFFAAAGLGIAQIGLLAGIYSGVLGARHLFPGALLRRLGAQVLDFWGLVTHGAGLGRLP